MNKTIYKSDNEKIVNCLKCFFFDLVFDVRPEKL